MMISFCTTCMGRAHHLKQTLPKNIADNAGADVEFVILDYNSKDDLAEWIWRKMRREMREGKVTFWQEKTAKFFHHSHAKNVAALLARGEIICNLDADNFTGPDYAKYLIDAMGEDGRTAIYHAVVDGQRGKTTMMKGSFMELRGYDESIQGYGYEDVDIMNRAMIHGLRVLPAGYTKGRAIRHSNDERKRNTARKSVWTSNAINMERCRSRCPWEIINPHGFGKATVYKNFSEEPVGVGCGGDATSTRDVPVSAAILYSEETRLKAERMTVPSVMRNFPKEAMMVRWGGAGWGEMLGPSLMRSTQPYIFLCLGGTVLMPGSIRKMVGALKENPRELCVRPVVRYIGCEPPSAPVAVLVRREACVGRSGGPKLDGMTVEGAVAEFLGL